MRIWREGGDVHVTQWYGMRVHIPESSIVSVEPLEQTTWWRGVGAHGSGGHWTVNTRRRPAIRVTIDPPARGRVLGVPVKVRILDLAPAQVEDVRVG